MTQNVLRPLIARRAALVGEDRVKAAAGTWRPRMLRGTLMVACAASAALAAGFADPSGFLQADPALARLLRFMAVIKGGVALGALGVVLWRFGSPVTTRVAIGYGVGCCALTGSAVLIWQLTWIPLAALLFHSAALGLLIVGWRER